MTDKTQKTPTEKRALIRAALEPLALTAQEKESIATALYKSVDFNSHDDFTDSKGFLDFKGKVTAVVKAFHAEGLTEKEYLAAVVKRPRILTASPQTMEDNIRGSAALLSPYSVTDKVYLKKALQRPQLFQQPPQTTYDNIEGVVTGFAKEGLTMQAYVDAALKYPQIFDSRPGLVVGYVNDLVKAFSVDQQSLKEEDRLTVEKYLHKAALKHPQLFCSKPETIETNIRKLAEALEADGLTVNKCLQAFLKRPTLFHMVWKTLADNIRGVTDVLEMEGLTRPLYLKAVIKNPGLISASPATVLGKIGEYFRMDDEGLIDIRACPQNTPENWQLPYKHHKLINTLVSQPDLMSNSIDNILQHKVLALVNGTKINAKHLKLSKAKVTDQLSAYVEALDHPLRDITPVEVLGEVPKTTIDATSVEYGEMLLVDLAKRGALDKNLTLKVMGKVGRAA